MEITEERINAAYGVATEEQKRVLDALFGKQQPAKCPKDNRPVTERIKTFEDAKREVIAMANDGNALATRLIDDFVNLKTNTKDLDAYLKLRIIVLAINEGWTPSWVFGEYRWAPWFRLYTQRDIDNMDDEDREDVLLIVGGGANYGSQCGLSCAGSSSGFSVAADIGARLAFKSEELSDYAGRQFIEIYAEYFGLEPKKKED